MFFVFSRTLSPLRSQPRPELSELVRALEKLTANEIRYLCIWLGVFESILSDIDADCRDALTRRTKYLQAWIDADKHTTWADLVKGLRSRMLNKGGLANKIAKRYCYVANPMPIPFDSKSLAPTFASPQARLGAIDRKLHPDHTQLSTSLCRSPSMPNDNGIANHAYDLKYEFNSVIVSAQVDLTMKKMRSGEFYSFKLSLTKLPVLTVSKKLRFLRPNEKKKILSAENVNAVFKVIDPYWNYVDYSLLEYIVRKYCSTPVKLDMRGYKERLHAFEKVTSVKRFTNAIQDDRVLPPNYSMLTATLGVDAEKCSLYQVRERLEKIVKRGCLQPYVAMIQGLYINSVILTIAFPEVVCKRIKRSLNKVFLQELGILPHSLQFNKTSTAMHASKLNIEQSFYIHIDDSAMPDPPQNVREEVYKYS